MMTVDGTPIGECLYPLDIDLVDYSRFERDPFGEITAIKRGYSDSVTFVVLASDYATATTARSTLASKRAEQAEYIGHPDHLITHITGYLRSLKTELVNWNRVLFTFTVDSGVMGEGE
jgi:hypothetical protein